MADFNFYAWATADSTAAGHSSAIALNSASAISFGGGNRASFQTNITLNTWTSAIHFALDTSESSTDYCAHGSHMIPLFPSNMTGNSGSTSASTGCWMGLTGGAGPRYNLMANGTPDVARGIGIQFTHGFAVKANPVSVWAGNQSDIDNDVPQSAYIAMCDLGSGVPTWQTVSPTNKLALNISNGSHDGETEEHWWSIGMAVWPYTVGHNGENQMKVEITYY